MFQSEQTFAGGVFHHSIPNGRAGADIEVTSVELRARTMGADSQSFSLKLADCELELGGASGRMVFCRNADRSLTIFSDERGFPAALSSASFGVLDERLEVLRRVQSSGNNRQRFWLGMSLLLIAAVCTGLYFGTLAIVQVAVRALPISVDEKIGQMASVSMTPGVPLAEQHSATVLVREIVKRIQPCSAIPEMDFRVVVVEADEVNAFALPGGQIYVYTGLIRSAENAEQIAGVLAHEMAHATLRHGLQKVSQSLGIVAAVQFMVGDMGGLIAFGAQVAQESVLTSYSRGAEKEADLEGARMLHDAGIDPAAMGEFFEILKHEHEELPAVLSWISTHPQHDDRISEIRRFKDSLPAVQYRRLDLSLDDAKRDIGLP